MAVCVRVGLMVALTVLGCSDGSLASSSARFLHQAVLDGAGTVRLWWLPQKDGILFRLRVDSDDRPDYIAMGISPNGGMSGADIALALFEDAGGGEVTLLDAFAEGNRRPEVDGRQDLELVSSARNDSGVEVVFGRRESCDLNDVSVEENTAVHVIWAYGRRDSDETRLMPAYHGSQRGGMLINLHRPNVTRFPESTPHVDILMSGVALPDDVQTLYYCRIFKLPRFPVRSHFIGFRALIEPGSEPFVHHLVVHECTVPPSRHAAFDEYVRSHPGTTCYSPNMPLEWARCAHVLVVWVVGGFGEQLPDQVGIPLHEEHGGATFLMAEFHYNNPQLVAGVVDHSGVRLYYTEQPRQFEGGTLNVGHDIAVTQMIPPRQDGYTMAGLCSSACTQADLPSDGVLIYSVLLHAHLAGTRLRLRHFDSSGRELAPVAQDPHYDFNYQQTWTLSEPVRLRPGDQLLMECTYGTAQRANVTFGGQTIGNEMCLAFVGYYPRVPLTLCWSSPDVGKVLESLGVEEVEVDGEALAVLQSGPLVHRVVDLFELSLRNQLDPLKNPSSSDGDDPSQVLKSLVAIPDLPDPLIGPYLATKDIMVTPSGGDRSKRSLFDHLVSHDWDRDSVQRLHEVVISSYRTKCVHRDGSVQNPGLQTLAELDWTMKDRLAKCSSPYEASLTPVRSTSDTHQRTPLAIFNLLLLLSYVAV